MHLIESWQVVLLCIGTDHFKADCKTFYQKKCLFLKSNRNIVSKPQLCDCLVFVLSTSRAPNKNQTCFTNL